MSATPVLRPNEAPAEGERHLGELRGPQRARTRLAGCLLLLAVLGAVTRLAWLGAPAEVVFDEVHFGKFASAYCCNGDRIFDIHPPHAKLLIAAAGYLGGYRGDFDFDHIGEPFTAPTVAALRYWPAVAGALLPLVLFALLLQLGASLPAALLGGVCVALDNALTLQSRHILIDSTLLLATFGALSAYLAARKRAGVRGALWAGLAGVAAAVAAGTKFTGLAALCLIGLLGLVDLWRAGPGAARRRWLAQTAVVAAATVAAYLAGWAAHFALLTKPGSGDPFLVPTGQFFTDLVEVHRVMLAVNYGLNFTHPDASPWWSWPFMLKPPLYWSAPAALMILAGNPVVWWGAALAFAAAVRRTLTLARARPQARGPRFEGLVLCIGGFALSFFPLTRVPRVLFMYHYFTPLLFTLMAACLWLDDTRPAWTGEAALRSRPAAAVALALVAGFALVSPLTFGWTPPGWYLDAVLRLLPLR